MSMVEVSRELVDALCAVVGREGLIQGPEERAVYECDAYTLERHTPGLVVLPRNASEAAAVVRLCAEHELPIVPRGAGTSLSGAAAAAGGGVVVAVTRMNRVLSVDERNRRVLVEAGCVNAWVTRAVAAGGWYYAPDPSSQSACTIGGNVATNSGGPHTLKYGVTTNHVLGFELVMPDGEVLWLGVTPEGGEELPGYDVRGAVIGCEGMFGVVTRVLLRLTASPESVRTMLAVFEGVDDASQTVSDIIASGIVPGALEMMDSLITQAVEAAYHFGFPLDAGAVLIIELDGAEAGMDRQVQRVMGLCRRNRAREVRLAKDETERAALWKSRKRAFGAIGRLSPNFLTQDGVVPRSRLPEMMRFIQGTAARHGLRIPNVFHAGDGNIHPLILFDERDADQVRRAVAAGNEILMRCVEMGGSVTGEHGIGLEKVDFMARQFTADDLAAMQTLRGVFDPEGRCNRHKMFPGGMRCMDFQPRKQVPA
jgi:glycolate oxidase